MHRRWEVDTAMYALRLEMAFAAAKHGLEGQRAGASQRRLEARQQGGESRL